MNPEERSLLEKTYKLTEENNKILLTIRRTGRISLWMRIIYWGLIIGISVGALYFIQPYFNFLTSAGSSSDRVNSTQNSLELFQDLLK